MKKILVAVLVFLVLFITHGIALAENWVFTAPNSNTNTNPYYSYGNAEAVESNRSYQAYSSDDAYYGTVTTNVVPEQSYDYSYSNTASTGSSSEYKAQPASFSERHPILTTIGLGTLLLGAAAVTTLLSDNDEDYKYDRDRRPPPRDHRYRDRGRNRDRGDYQPFLPQESIRDRY